MERLNVFQSIKMKHKGKTATERKSGLILLLDRPGSKALPQ